MAPSWRAERCVTDLTIERMRLATVYNGPLPCETGRPPYCWWPTTVGVCVGWGGLNAFCTKKLLGHLHQKRWWITNPDHHICTRSLLRGHLQLLNMPPHSLVLRSSTPPCANGRWSTLVSALDVLIIAGRQGGHQHQVYQGESIVQKKLNGRPSHPDARNESKVYQKSGLKCRAERARVGVV